MIFTKDVIKYKYDLNSIYFENDKLIELSNNFVNHILHEGGGVVTTAKACL